VDGRVVRAGGGPFEEVLFLIGVDPFGRSGRSAWVREDGVRYTFFVVRWGGLYPRG
jgi:hypothetical protein